jgi:hypothetical protein
MLFAVLAMVMLSALGGCGGNGLLFPSGVPIDAQIVDNDGYVFHVTGLIPDSLNFVHDVTYSKPGEASIVPPSRELADLKFTNVNPGRSASVPSTIWLMPVYERESFACQLLGQDMSPGSYGQAMINYCLVGIIYTGFDTYSEFDGSLEPITEGKSTVITFTFQFGS